MCFTSQVWGEELPRESSFSVAFQLSHWTFLKPHVLMCALETAWCSVNGTGSSGTSLPGCIADAGTRLYSRGSWASPSAVGHIHSRPLELARCSPNQKIHSHHQPATQTWGFPDGQFHGCLALSDPYFPPLTLILQSRDSLLDPIPCFKVKLPTPVQSTVALFFL